MTEEVIFYYNPATFIKSAGNNMNLKIIITASLLTLMTTVVAAPASPSESSKGLVAKPIPPSFHFPTSVKEINKWIATSNTKAMRNHAWDLWAGMNSNSDEMYQGRNLPIWETWYGFNEVFQFESTGDNTPTKMEIASHRQAMHAFVIPHQLIFRQAKFTKNDILGPLDQRLGSFNKFNSDAAAFMLAAQEGPDGKMYHYTSSKSRDALNNAWPANTLVENRGINEFPETAIETKPVFSVIKGAGLTVIPVWQGVTASTQPDRPVSSAWTSCVLVDPKGITTELRKATKLEISSAEMPPELSCKEFYYGSLSMFYSFRLTPEEVSAFNNIRGQRVKEGDYAILLAMHVNTHEAPFWTWQTFYWMPSGVPNPNVFPGSKADQPRKLKSPWNNYAMCSNYSQTTKPGGNIMDICYNPYLEVALPAGLESNCMSCHGVARTGDLSTNPVPTEYKKPISFFGDPLYFNANTTHTKFSWALATLGQEK
jgi:hypothetical protein